MKVEKLHEWEVSAKEAIALQRELAGRVRCTSGKKGPCRWIAGVDVSCGRYSKRLFAGVVVCDARTWKVVETAGTDTQSLFDYIPGLLSFREAPGILAAFEKLRIRPDLVIVDGAGYAHPRRFGLACHVGLSIDLPTIGCAKSRLLGEYREPSLRRGSYRQLTDRGETIGRVVRTCDRVRPLFLSVGHRISLSRATRRVLSSCRGYRLPEPVRLAHHYVGQLRSESRNYEL